MARNAIALLLGALLLASGCTAVRPWEREQLSRPEMAWDPDGLEAAHRSHVFHSKEASLPVAEAGGGGCGCN